jgi:hypothetical protein
MVSKMSSSKLTPFFSRGTQVIGRARSAPNTGFDGRIIKASERYVRGSGAVLLNNGRDKTPPIWDLMIRIIQSEGFPLAGAHKFSVDFYPTTGLFFQAEFDAGNFEGESLILSQCEEVLLRDL